MVKKIELFIYENGKTVDTIEKEIETESSQIIKSIEEFRQTVNITLTKKIEGGELLEDYIEDDLNSSEGEEEPIQSISPKKRKL